MSHFSTTGILGGGGGGVVLTLTGNSGVATAVANNINIVTANSTPIFVGSGSTLTLDFNISSANLMLGTTNNNGTSNVGIGNSVLANRTTASQNVAIGQVAGNALTTGADNTFIGHACGQTVTTGKYNVCLGSDGLNTATTASRNVVIGTSIVAPVDSGPLWNLKTGVNNIAIGCNLLSDSTGAGWHYNGSESNNIIIGAAQLGSPGESNVMRLGSSGGGEGQVATTYIAGINGVNVGNVASVVTINTSTEQLGSAVIVAGTGITVTPTASTITIANTSSGGIGTINGNTGSATGTTVTLQGTATTCGTMYFSGSGSTLTLNVEDSGGNNNILIGGGSTTTVSGGGNCNMGHDPYFLSAGVTGQLNQSFGYNSLASLTSGSHNAAFGQQPLISLKTGSYNLCAAAYQGGVNYNGAESNNITLNCSNNSVAGESNVLRIGDGTGTGTQQLNKAFICGIQGITVTGTPILISASDQLGIAVSSERFKENISDLKESKVLQLQPKSFIYKIGDDRSKQTGLIAEEVYEVMPELVVLDKEGLPQSVKYQDLPVLLLLELQRAHKRIDELEKKLR